MALQLLKNAQSYPCATVFDRKWLNPTIDSLTATDQKRYVGTAADASHPLFAKAQTRLRGGRGTPSPY